MVNGVYIPSGLLIIGTAIVKIEWLPYAVALAAVLSGFKLFNATRERSPSLAHSQWK